MKHGLQFTGPKGELGNADVFFDVKINGEKLGTLGVWKGSLLWYPKNYSYGHKLTWTEFDRIMHERPREEKR